MGCVIQTLKWKNESQCQLVDTKEDGLTNEMSNDKSLMDRLNNTVTTCAMVDF